MQKSLYYGKTRNRSRILNLDIVSENSKGIIKKMRLTFDKTYKSLSLLPSVSFMTSILRECVMTKRSNADDVRFDQITKLVEIRW